MHKSLLLTPIVALSLTLGGAAAALAGPTSKAAHADTKDSNVAVWRQKNQFLGDTSLYLAKESGKFVARGGNLVVLCAAPDWRVMIYRTDDKKAMVKTLQDWEYNGFKVMQPKARLTNAPHTPCFIPQIKQVGVEYIAKSNKRFFEASDSMVFRSDTKKNIQSITCITTNKIDMGPQMQRFIHGLYGQPWCDELPVELRTATTDGTNIVTYSLISMHKETVPASFWNYPKGVTIATRIDEVMASKKEEKKAQEILDSLIDEIKEKKGN